MTKSLTQTLESLRKLSAIEEKVPESVSGPQLVGVLQKLTVALRTPGKTANHGDTEELVGFLERIALALKAPKQEPTGNVANALPASARHNGDNSE